MSVQNQLVEVFETIKEQYSWAIVEHRYQAKSDILVEDNDDQDVFLIREGKAAVILGGGNSEIILGKGDLIGEMSFLLGNKRTASIVAKEQVLCWSVNVQSMETIFDTEPMLAAKFYKALGGLIAMRLINDSKRHVQELVFQEDDDALISLMKIQATEQRDHMENLCRLIINRLKKDIQEAKETLKNIQRHFLPKNGETSTLQVRQDRQNQMLQLTKALQEKQELLFVEYKDRIKQIFVEIQNMLLEILDLEKRNEVGANTLAIFSETILQKVPVLQKRKMGTSEQVEPLLLVAHLLQENPVVDSDIWDAQQVVAGWFDRIFMALPTIVAYRSRNALLAETIIQSMPESSESKFQLTLFNDSAGVVLAKIYNKIARFQTQVYAISHDPTTLYYMDLGMDVRSGRVDMKFHRIKSILSLLLGRTELLPPNVALGSQDLIVIDGLMDYLPDRYLVNLIEKSLPYLAPKGSLLIAGILPTKDQSLITDFFQWPMVRRRKEDVQQIIRTLNLKVHLYTEKNSIVIRAQVS